MKDVEILTQMLNPSNLISLSNEMGKYSVTLTEPKAKDSKVVIQGLPEDLIVIKLDDTINQSKLFRGKNSECKCADFALITESEKYIFFIELKQAKSKENEIANQLRGANCLLEYCKSIGSNFWKNPNFLDNYKKRYISFKHTGSFRKHRQVIEREFVNDTPDQFLKMSWPHRVEFNKIKGLKN